MLHTVYHLHNDILKDGSNFFFLTSTRLKSTSRKFWSGFPGTYFMWKLHTPA